MNAQGETQGKPTGFAVDPLAALAEAQAAMNGLLDLVIETRARLVAAGVGADAADRMAEEFLRLLLRGGAR